MKKRILAVTVLFAIVSCATEKSTRPQPGIDIGTPDMIARISDNANAAEISNLISSFPTFSKKELNDEISVLKNSLQNYLFAVDASNIKQKNKQINYIHGSYKKIQKLRQALKTDENNLLNRYLVRIKTNLAVLENSLNSK